MKPCKNGHPGEFRYKPANLNYVICRICTKESGKRFRDKLKKTNPEETLRRTRVNNLRHFFQMELEDYDALHAKQAGLCAICGKPERVVKRGRIERLAVDHDHKSGKVRELLCGHCNKAIGLFYEDTDIMARAIHYLKRHRGE